MSVLIADMMSDLGIEIEDPNETEWTKPKKVRMLNKAQRAVVSKLHPNNRRILDISQDAIDLNVLGALDLTTLTTVPYQTVNGIDGIQLVSNGEFCELISWKQYKQFKSVQHAFRTDDPRYYVRGNSIYVLPFSDDAAALTSINFEGFRAAATMVDDQAAPANNVDCELIDEAADIIVLWAAYLIFSVDDGDRRARMKFDMATEALLTLNGGKPLTESKGPNRLAGTQFRRGPVNVVVETV